MCVYVYICMYVCMYVCIIRIYVCTYTRITLAPPSESVAALSTCTCMYMYIRTCTYVYLTASIHHAMFCKCETLHAKITSYVAHCESSVIKLTSSTSGSILLILQCTYVHVYTYIYTCTCTYVCI